VNSLVDVWWVAFDDGPTFVGRQQSCGDLYRQDKHWTIAIKRARMEARRRALRLILGNYVNRERGALHFDRSCRRCGHPTHGKPRLAGRITPVHFSASSTKGLAVVAVSQTAELGVDVEAVSECMNNRERDELARWTRYEAVSKATGEGIIDFQDWEGLPDQAPIPTGWVLADLSSPELFIAALAAQDQGALLIQHYFLQLQMDGLEYRDLIVPAVSSFPGGH